MHMSAYEFNGCYAHYDPQSLVVGNERMERRWDMSGGVPVSVSLLNKIDGVEWLNTDKSGRQPICGLPLWNVAEAIHEVHVTMGTDDDRGIAATHLLVQLVFSWGKCEMKLELLVYPGEAWIRQRLWVRKAETKSAGAAMSSVEDGLHQDNGVVYSGDGEGVSGSGQELLI